MLQELQGTSKTFKEELQNYYVFSKTEAYWIDFVFALQYFSLSCIQLHIRCMNSPYSDDLMI